MGVKLQDNFLLVCYFEIYLSLFIKKSLNCGCFVCFDLELLPKIGKEKVGTEGTQDTIWSIIYDKIQLFY